MIFFFRFVHVNFFFLISDLQQHQKLLFTSCSVSVRIIHLYRYIVGEEYAFGFAGLGRCQLDKEVKSNFCFPR